MIVGIVPEVCSSGGSYLYSLGLLRAVSSPAFCGSDEFVCLLEGDDERVRSIWPSQPELLGGSGLRSRLKSVAKSTPWIYPLIQVYRSARRFQKSTVATVPDPDAIRVCEERRRVLTRLGIDFVIYGCPSAKSFEAGVPFMMPIHDLQHRLQPQFPEVSSGGEWERREYLFRNAARHATTILTDSETGKADVLEFYGDYIDAEQVEILPYYAIHSHPTGDVEVEIERVARAYQLPRPYLFYPAQFWPHKNHARIIRAMALLKQTREVAVRLVFSGSHSGEIREHTFKEVMSLARQLGVLEQVCYLGYVDDEDMPGLFAGSYGLVMPTFFGPTNIPVLEAWALGCPVLTSDIRGIREQAGDAALLADPSSVESIAEGIYSLWTEPQVRRQLIERGRVRVQQFSVEEFHRRFRGAFEQTRERVLAKGSLCRTV